MSVFTLLRNNPTPTRDELEKAIEGKKKGSYTLSSKIE